MRLLTEMPIEWAVPVDKVKRKMEELFYPQWVSATWVNFVECLKSNSSYGQ